MDIIVKLKASITFLTLPVTSSYFTVIAKILDVINHLTCESKIVLHEKITMFEK